MGLWLRRRGARAGYDVHELAPAEALSVCKDTPAWARVRAGVAAGLDAAARAGCDAFVCATPEIGRHFPAERTTVIRNFPRLEEYVMPEVAAVRRPHVVFAGGISDIRGAREMVDAIGLVPEALGARLVLAGAVASPALHADLERRPGWARVDFGGGVGFRFDRTALARSPSGIRPCRHNDSPEAGQTPVCQAG